MKSLDMLIVGPAIAVLVGLGPPKPEEQELLGVRLLSADGDGVAAIISIDEDGCFLRMSAAGSLFALAESGLKAQHDDSLASLSARLLDLIKPEQRVSVGTDNAQCQATLRAGQEGNQNIAATGIVGSRASLAIMHEDLQKPRVFFVAEDDGGDVVFSDPATGNSTLSRKAEVIGND